MQHVENRLRDRQRNECRLAMVESNCGETFSSTPETGQWTHRRHELLLIHGTFAYATEDSGPAWWQRESQFHSWLSKVEGQRYDCQPQAQIFRWNGKNLESERRHAAQRLSRQILGYERGGRKYAIIAHSHGGSVAHHALALTNQAVPGLPNLVRLVTVGTPFLSFRLDFTPWLLLIPLLVSAYCLAVLAAFLVSLYPSSWNEFALFREWKYLLLVPCLTIVVAVTALHVSRVLFGVALNQIRQAMLDRAHRSLRSLITHRFATVFSAEDEAIAAVGGTLALAGEPIIPWPRHLWLGGTDAMLAMIGDQYVIAKLNERTQGADLTALRLRWVGPAPLMAATSAWLDDAASQKLVAHANGSLTEGVTAIRRALTELTWNAEPLGYLRTAASESGFGKGLIHTSYFAVPEVCEIIRKALRGEEPDPKCVRAVAPPKLRSGIFSAIPLFTAYSVAASAVALVPYALTVPYLRPLIGEQVVRDAVDQAPVPSASWEIQQGPPEAVRIVGRLVETDQIAKFASKLAQTNSPLRMYSELALGLADRGLSDLARGYVDTAKRYTQREGTAQIRTIGLSLAISEDKKLYTRALARVGTPAQVDEFAIRITGQIDDRPTSRRAADELAAEATVGFAASGDQAAARHEFGRISDEFVKRDALLAIIEQSTDAGFIESLIAQIHAQDLRQDLQAELISNRHLTLAITDLSRIIGSIDRAAPRAIATSVFAERLGREGGFPTVSR
jgi:hypothetical protein